ncbi:MAG: hypothetical protein JWQ16_1737 [Novosphingobium sp.]|nr:hypothetical protein [Novosphingobium sp.]
MRKPSNSTRVKATHASKLLAEARARRGMALWRPPVADPHVVEHPSAEATEFVKAVAELVARAPAIAEMKRQLYLAYVEAGFNEHQAIELCKSY